MNERKSRLSEIIDILTHNDIGSQEELSRKLAARGCSVTQATLSRDLKMLRTTKVATDFGGYRYVMSGGGFPGRVDIRDVSRPLCTLKPAALSMALSGNMVVLKTRPGYAGGLAYDIDMLESPHIIGTIAGADTVFVTVNECSSREEIFEAFTVLLPEDVAENARKSFFG